MEDEEALKTTAVVCQAANLIHHIVDLFFTDSVVTTSVWGDSSATIHGVVNWVKRHTVASGILLASHESLGMEKTPVSSRPHFINNIWLQVNIE